MAIFHKTTGERLDDDNGQPLAPEHAEALRAHRIEAKLPPEAPPVEGAAPKAKKAKPEASAPPETPPAVESSDEPPAETSPHGAGPDAPADAPPPATGSPEPIPPKAPRAAKASSKKKK